MRSNIRVREAPHMVKSSRAAERAWFSRIDQTGLWHSRIYWTQRTIVYITVA